MDCVTIDFEASCLPRHGRSFPIEVGIAGREGSRSWLIRPHAAWHDWGWTDEALALHRITPGTLDRHGLPPVVVFNELTRAVRGKRIIADSTLDTMWWNTLADAAGSNYRSPIEHIGVVLGELDAPSELVFEAQRKADLRAPERHRAAADAHWLWLVVTAITEALGPAMQDDVSRSWPAHRHGRYRTSHNPGTAFRRSDPSAARSIFAKAIP